MGEVILGMPGPWADDFYEAADHYTTKFGGLPDWPMQNMAIPNNLLVCESCGTSLLLVAQIYAPVSTQTLTIEERQIFVFVCISATCGSNSESWVAIRVQRASGPKNLEVCEEADVPTPGASRLASKADWKDDFWSLDCGEGDDDDDDIDLEELGKALSEAANLASNSKKKSIPHQFETTTDSSSSTTETTRVTSNDTPVLPCFYVYTLKERIKKDVASICLGYNSLSIKENQDCLDDSSTQEVWDEEGYEYDRALSANRTYLKFKKRMDAHPEQCFRYSYGGKPLLASEELGDPGRCELCGGTRHYEMQIMPPLLYFLQQATSEQNYTLENWNWMTLFIYTCSSSCSNSVEEISRDGEWILAKETLMLQTE